MSFKEPNFNKGFNKPKLEPKDYKNDVNTHRVSPKTKIENQNPKLNIGSKNKIERLKVSTPSRNKIEILKVKTVSNNKIEKPKLSIDQKNKLEQLKNDKIKNPEIQKNKINPKKRYLTNPKDVNLEGYVKPVVDDWLDNVRKRQIQLRLGPGKQYISLKDRNEAIRHFLKPVLEKIIKDGYKTNDIIQSFGKHGRNIVDRAIPQLFENKSFSEIRRNYLKKDLIKFIKMGLGPKAIDKQLQNHSLTEINSAIKEEWGSLDLAQKFLWKDLIISKIRNGEHPKRFLLEFGYSENSARSQYNRVFQRLFNGMTYKQIKEKINNSSNSNYF